MCSIDGPIACHDTTDDLDYFSQPRIFYRQILTADERTQSARNLARSLSLTQQFISKWAIAHFACVDEDLAKDIEYFLTLQRRIET